MGNTRVFVNLALLSALLIIGAVAGGAFIDTSQQQTSQQSRPTYTTFSNDTPSAFSILQRTDKHTDRLLSASTSVTTSSPPSIVGIIRKWETRPGAKTAQTLRARNVQTDSLTNSDTSRNYTNSGDELTALWRDLITSTQQHDAETHQNTYTSHNTELIWDGTYNDSTAPRSNTTSATPAQAKLRVYGNKLGALLKQFQVSHGNQVAVLERFIDNQSDTEELKQISDAYIALAKTIDTLDAPATVTRIHADLVNAYADVGEQLWQLAFATSDEDLLTRMNIYNESSAEVARLHVQFVTLLQAHDITYQPGEGGSIFTFTPTVAQ